MSNSKITRFFLENYKCHKMINVELKPLTILTGSNAAGKSSFLQALVLGLEAFRKRSWSINNKQKSNNYDPMSKESLHIQTDNVFGLDLGLPRNIIMENSDATNTKICFWDEKITTELTFYPPKEEDDLYFEVIRKQSSINPKNFSTFVLEAERQGPRLVSKIDHLRPYSVGNHGENTAYLIANLNKRRGKKLMLPAGLSLEGQERFQANCEAWLNMIIPDTELKCEIEIEKKQALLQFRNSGGEFHLPTETGFGITYVLPVIAQALAASLLKNSILIVENPEAHLHPRSQSMLGRFLALVSESGVQVIIETHSDHIIDGCRIQSFQANKCDEVKILFFEKDSEGSHCQEIDLENNGELVKWPQGFFDQLQIDLRDLIELRREKK